jgi:hypothetical protein
MKNKIAKLATATLASGGLAAGLAMAGLGTAAGTAQADIGPFPEYHWCPRQPWDPGWGFNWDGGVCHDDHHRDNDAGDHSRDWWGGDGPAGYVPRYHWCPGQFWDPGWGFNWDWGTCHDDHHRDNDAGDHSRDWWG